jgi:hypothetical protein
MNEENKAAELCMKTLTISEHISYIVIKNEDPTMQYTSGILNSLTIRSSELPALIDLCSKFLRLQASHKPGKA